MVLDTIVLIRFNLQITTRESKEVLIMRTRRYVWQGDNLSLIQLIMAPLLCRRLPRDTSSGAALLLRERYGGDHESMSMPFIQPSLLSSTGYEQRQSECSEKKWGVVQVASSEVLNSMGRYLLPSGCTIEKKGDIKGVHLVRKKKKTIFSLRSEELTVCLAI